MAEFEFSSALAKSAEPNPEFDNNGSEGRDRSLNSFRSTNGDINALKFAARDIRSLSLAGETNTEDAINFLSKEIGDQGLDSQLNQDQLQDVLKDLQLDNSINYNLSNVLHMLNLDAESNTKEETADKSASISNTTNYSGGSFDSEKNYNGMIFPPFSTPLPPTFHIPEQSPFEMMSPFEPNDLPETPQKKQSLGEAPYSLDAFIDSSPFESTSYITPSSYTGTINVTNSGQNEISASPTTYRNFAANGPPRSTSGDSTGMPIYSNNVNSFANIQPSTSPQISVVSMSPTTRKFEVLKQLAPLASSPPIVVKNSPLSAPNSPRNEISKNEDEIDSKSSGRSNSLNSTYGSTQIQHSGGIPKKEYLGAQSRVHEPQELMETIVVDQVQSRQSAWVVHKPITKDYQLGSHRKSTAVNSTTVAQLNAISLQPRSQSVKFTEPMKDNNDKSKWQAIAKHEAPKIGKEGVRKHRKSVLTRSTSASALPRTSVSKESVPYDSNNNNMENNNKILLRKNSVTDMRAPLQISKSESVIQELTTSTSGITPAPSEPTAVGGTIENNNNSEPGEKTKPRRKSLIGKLTRTLSSTFKPLISGKEKDSTTSPVNSGQNSLSSSPTSALKSTTPPVNEKRKKRAASDVRSKAPTAPIITNDRDRSQTVVTFNEIQRNLVGGPYSANGIFGVPLDILYQQNDNAIPDLINVCCGYLEQKALNLEGLFRISPTMTEVNQWKADLTFESMHKLNDIDNPHIVASLLKQFFLDLPDPLFTDQLFKQFQDSTDVENDTLRKIKLEELLNKLPEAHYVVLKFLITFLRKVAKHSHENKMDARNLGLVLSPSVLRRKSAVFDVADLSKAKQHWMIIYDLIVNYDLIGDNPPN